MRIEDIPLLGPLVAAGADDRVFDAFLLAGPIVILLIAALGRTWASIAIALAYLGGFVTYIAYNGITSSRIGSRVS